MSYQIVIIQGNLGSDPESNHLPSGGMVTKFSVATSKKWRDKNSGEMKEETAWHRVVLFNRTAEVAAEFLRKGSGVLIEGELKYGSYEKEGIKRYTTDIVGNKLKMLGSKSGTSAAGSGSSSDGGHHSTKPAPDFDSFDDDIPF